MILGNIDEEYIRIIDLTKDKFFYRTDLTQIDQDWGGVALIVSNDPINSPVIDIPDAQLNDIIGSGGYSCTNLLQEYDVILCDEPIGGECSGNYYIFYERWGCEAAASGSCSSSQMLRFEKTPCINNPHDPYVCIVSGNWTSYYMRACN